jgi:hypothetical protein
MASHEVVIFIITAMRISDLSVGVDSFSTEYLLELAAFGG